VAAHAVNADSASSAGIQRRRLVMALSGKVMKVHCTAKRRNSVCGAQQPLIFR
jgi:hypothetical protein